MIGQFLRRTQGIAATDARCGEQIHKSFFESQAQTQRISLMTVHMPAPLHWRPVIGSQSRETALNRPTLESARIHPAIQATIANQHADVVSEVQTAASTHPVLVVGMRQNPFPKRARKALDAAGVPYKYLEYGSYFSEWRARLALKMWSGWPTFPMIFVKGVLIGGAEDLQALLKSGELQKLLASRAAN